MVARTNRHGHRHDVMLTVFALIGLGLFGTGAALSLVMPPSVGDHGQRTALPVVESAVMDAHPPSDVARSPTAAPCGWRAVHVESLFSMRINGDTESSSAALDAFLSRLESSLRGLGSHDVRFFRPWSDDALGTLAFKDEHEQEWLLPVTLERASDSFNQSRITMRIWLAPIPGPTLNTDDPEAMRRAWDSVRREIELPLLDAAADIPGVEITIERDTNGDGMFSSIHADHDG